MDEAAALNSARRSAERVVFDGENFKANICPPPGKNFEFQELVDKVKAAVESVEDDNFFHITCHLDKGLEEKIERGEFVDLEKLLPKNRKRFNEDNVMETVNHNGSTYFMPAEKDNKISGIRKWEQAFRVYAAVYCNANPKRSSEIWQYVYTINLAASSYSWDNVYYYDYIFRHLMEDKPYRSWGKTYNQLWNLALRDPITTNNKFFQNSNKSGNWKDQCCWRFNRGTKCKKWNCDFDHRCKGCSSYSHGQNTCPKKK